MIFVLLLLLPSLSRTTVAAAEASPLGMAGLSLWPEGEDRALRPCDPFALILTHDLSATCLGSGAQPEAPSETDVRSPGS